MASELWLHAFRRVSLPPSQARTLSAADLLRRNGNNRSSSSSLPRSPTTAPRYGLPGNSLRASVPLERRPWQRQKSRFSTATGDRDGTEQTSSHRLSSAGFGTDRPEQPTDLCPPSVTEVSALASSASASASYPAESLGTQPRIDGTQPPTEQTIPTTDLRSDSNDERPTDPYHEPDTQPPDSPRTELKTCAEHLDPDGTILPKSSWIRLSGTHPTCALEDIVKMLQDILEDEEQKGIINLDGPWCPSRDEAPPLLTADNARIRQPSASALQHPNGTAILREQPWIEAAHVFLSRLGRPNGWYIKFRNRSVANAVLSVAQQRNVYCTWKLVDFEEWVPEKSFVEPLYVSDYPTWQKASKRRGGGGGDWKRNRLQPIVNDCMVRVEGCPQIWQPSNLLVKLSRYELTMERPAVTRWIGGTSSPSMGSATFIVEFSDPSWARAAIRELQDKLLVDTRLMLTQYPKQIAYMPAGTETDGGDSHDTEDYQEA